MSIAALHSYCQLSFLTLQFQAMNALRLSPKIFIQLPFKTITRTSRETPAEVFCFATIISTFQFISWRNKKSSSKLSNLTQCELLIPSVLQKHSPSERLQWQGALWHWCPQHPTLVGDPITKVGGLCTCRGARLLQLPPLQTPPEVMSGHTKKLLEAETAWGINSRIKQMKRRDNEED